MRKKIAIARLAGLILGVLFLYGGYSLAVNRDRTEAEFDELLERRPMEVAVDFSKCGVTTAPFRHSCSIHSVALCVKTPLTGQGQQSPEERLRELSATIVITDPNGQEIRRTRIDRISIYRGSGDDEIVVSGFPPFPAGEYSATIDVDGPVAALAGENTVLLAKYSFCGCERIGEWFSGVLSTVHYFIGICLLLLVAPGLVRHGFWRHRLREDEAPNPNSNGGSSC